MKAYSLPLSQSDIHWEAALYAPQLALSIEYVFYPLQLYKDKCTRKFNQMFSMCKRRVKDFAELFNFTTSGIAIFPLQNKPTLRSHLLHTEPQRHNPPTPCSAYDKSSWCMASSAIQRGPERAVVCVLPGSSCFSSHWSMNPHFYRQIYIVCVLLVKCMLSWREIDLG